MTQKLLSICIPTFNRAALLDKLLEQIASFDIEILNKIQVCISNNSSDDHTLQIIKKWKKIYDLVYVNQSSNIGASKNFQEVARLANGSWVVFMGDDDLFSIEGLVSLLDLLEKKDNNTWIIVNVKNLNGSNLINIFVKGYISKRRFKQLILLKTLDTFGFMSSHIIPKKSIDIFINLNQNQIFAWPHLALLFIELNNINIYIENKYLVLREGFGKTKTQTWKSFDWLKIMMQKTKLISYSSDKITLYNNILTIREYVRWPFVRQLLQVYLINKNKDKIKFIAKNYINESNVSSIVKRLIINYISFVLFVPLFFLIMLEKLKNKNKMISVNSNTKDTDAIERGL